MDMPTRFCGCTKNMVGPPLCRACPHPPERFRTCDVCEFPIMWYVCPCGVHNSFQERFDYIGCAEDETGELQRTKCSMVITAEGWTTLPCPPAREPILAVRAGYGETLLRFLQPCSHYRLPGPFVHEPFVTARLAGEEGRVQKGEGVGGEHYVYRFE